MLHVDCLIRRTYTTWVRFSAGPQTCGTSTAWSYNWNKVSLRSESGRFGHGARFSCFTSLLVLESMTAIDVMHGVDE